jgi:uncharacterized repeat protein (TIGR03803 family)
MGRLFALAALAVLTAEVVPAQTSYQTIYSFGKLPDGAQPNASLVIGPQGSLFGTTLTGGAYGGGTVFELSSPTGTAWTESVLYSFSGANGQYPYANVVFGPNGALYGTTDGGGSGGGTVFELAPPTGSGGSWTETVLYAFSSDIHAQVNAPSSAVLFGSKGVLYATAAGGNINAYGGVVALAPPATAGGTRKESTITTFGGTAGGNPYAGLVSDGKNMYGTNYYLGDEFCGVTSGCGAVYELTPPAAAGDGWTVAPVWDFLGAPNDGAYPFAPLAVAPGGPLYGTTDYGGSGVCSVDGRALNGCGTVFQLTPPSTPGAAWTESVIYNFTGTNGDGILPAAGVVIGKNGALYGTTERGGNISSSSPCQASYLVSAGCGIVFELMPPTTPGGAWTETILHTFTGLDGDGALPTAGLVMSSSGVLYGTTSSGGADGKGTVFAIKP